jgi:hypothetical protein
MLLHCTRLNADTLDKLARILRRARLTPVTLTEALTDPVYRQLEPYVGRHGMHWLETKIPDVMSKLPTISGYFDRRRTDPSKRSGRARAANMTMVGTASVNNMSFAPSPYCCPGSGHCSIQRSTVSLKRITANNDNHGHHDVTGRRSTNPKASHRSKPIKMCRD